ncbi:hypothetical protein M406DRAFT_355964 [Cryphonectria parasitica EP155]|uniref:Uncharacterized protein n=1 Tax=Cryphonectria parasitica (strain ATCC 38755 / EP155) TaxID=660469 RepID=A0A9P5CPL3_CRYP1|nr:uncharacterized protein M406DRAFT_355964 [Cryphonectria parasitica EP155]KAF3765542.1 hypothetical protein M406DRAFT_355964 [Cryphonectria parasitica EP155]
MSHTEECQDAFEVSKELSAKYVPDPKRLPIWLTRTLGKTGFSIQMRNNVYIISASETFDIAKLAEYCGYQGGPGSLRSRRSNVSEKSAGRIAVK